MKKLEAQELEKLQNLYAQKQSCSMNIGIAAVTKEIEVRKANKIFNDANASFQSTLDLEMNHSKIIESKIDDFVKELNKKYGEQMYDLNTGEFIVQKTE